MNVILYMAMSADGYIARGNHETPWSDEEWQSYARMVKSVGNIVIGKTTYEIMSRSEEFRRLDHPRVVVVSREVLSTPPNVSVVSSPHEALDTLEASGFSVALVAGGGMLNASFASKGLIDEVYIDIEPMMFGRGIRFFGNAEKDIAIALELIETVKISKDAIQLHYRVKKPH